MMHIEKYFFAKINKESISSSHQRIILVCITKFYDLVLDKKINLKHLYPKHSDYKLPFALSVGEVKKIIEVNENLKHKCIIMVLYSAGLRLSEVVQLKLVDIDFRMKTITIRHQINNNYRQVMLSEKLAIILKQYYSKYKPVCYLFEGQNNTHFSSRSIQQIVRQSAVKSGVNFRPYSNKRMRLCCRFWLYCTVCSKPGHRFNRIADISADIGFGNTRACCCGNSCCCTLGSTKL